MLYTVSEAATYLNEQIVITEPMIRYYLRNKRIQGKWTGNSWVIEKRELDKFIKNSK